MLWQPRRAFGEQDKYVWSQGRMTWAFSALATLYPEQEQAYLRYARFGVNFNGTCMPTSEWWAFLLVKERWGTERGRTRDVTMAASMQTALLSWGCLDMVR